VELWGRRLQLRHRHRAYTLGDTHARGSTRASDDVFEKVASNTEEVRSRGGQVIAFVSDGDRKLEGKANYLYRVPGTVPCLTPVLMAVPLQLLAYKVALLRGSDVDQPRNLAKSVTVE
jgi:glutamine---fructose-6-phosphate transaminase (isomerizing)